MTTIAIGLLCFLAGLATPVLFVVAACWLMGQGEAKFPPVTER